MMYLDQEDKNHPSIVRAAFELGTWHTYCQLLDEPLKCWNVTGDSHASNLNAAYLFAIQLGYGYQYLFQDFHGCLARTTVHACDSKMRFKLDRLVTTKIISVPKYLPMKHIP
jgi:hypothetical protein